MTASFSRGMPKARSGWEVKLCTRKRKGSCTRYFFSIFTRAFDLSMHADLPFCPNCALPLDYSDRDLDLDSMAVQDYYAAGMHTLWNSAID